MSSNVFPQFCLGPMAGISDAAMRSICISMGAPIAFTEMVSARGLIEGNANTGRLLSHFDNEKQLVVQIFGSSPEDMGEACSLLCARMKGVLLGIDINMGCPAPKVFRHGEGAALMGRPSLAAAIVEKCVLNSNVPVSVKMRAGLNDTSMNAVEFAQLMAKAGAARITVHGRTASMGYRGHSDPSIIARVKETVQIPVLANGDVNTADEAMNLKTSTGADGVMIARGAVGNPFLFREVAAVFSGNRPPAPAGPRERLETLLAQTRLAIEDKGVYVGLREMRTQIPKYLKGLHGAAAVRSACNGTETYEELENLLMSYLRRLEDG